MSYPQNFGGKFGLVLAPGLAKKKQAAVAAAARRPTGLSVFGADDLDEGPAAAAVNAEVLRHQAQAAKQTAAHVESVDESVYDYDSFLDGEAEAKKARASAAAREAAVKPVRESKYISSLLSQAKQRELERERIYERKLVKERMEDDKEHGDKPMLVTEGYKRKLEEQRKVCVGAGTGGRGLEAVVCVWA
ncbi:MAG: nuclear speckle splicing regulatory protein 1 family protein [Terracidiphilus sp.]|nr:nuclear speckle splicing regulatory protein 1 family protein [Terracidiphilus sp.]